MQICVIEEDPTKLFLNGIEFNEYTKWNEVKNNFSHESFSSNRSDEKITVNCLNVVIHENEVEILINIYFVDGMIKSATIHIPLIDNDYDHNDSMDFYVQSEKRDRLYTKWLDDHMIKSSIEAENSFIVVGADKSTNTYIVIHWDDY